jgi:hypothetical protein
VANTSTSIKKNKSIENENIDIEVAAKGNLVSSTGEYLFVDSIHDVLSS